VERSRLPACPFKLKDWATVGGESLAEVAEVARGENHRVFLIGVAKGHGKNKKTAAQWELSQERGCPSVAITINFHKKTTDQSRETSAG
jgi:hypothetical protein